MSQNINVSMKKHVISRYISTKCLKFSVTLRLHAQEAFVLFQSEYPFIATKKTRRSFDASEVKIDLKSLFGLIIQVIL